MTQTEIETNTISNILTSKYNDFDYISTTSSFQKMSFYEKLVIEQNLKMISLNELKTIFNEKFQNIKLESSRELENIFWKDIDNDRHYIFDITISSLNYGFTRTFTIYIIITNIKNYLLDDGTLSNLKQISNYIIKNIKEKSSNVKFTFLSEDPNDFYEIKNTLHLMDPFITTGKELQITDAMKDDFNKKLEEIDKKIQLYSNGKCFDENNNIIFEGPNNLDNINKCQSIITQKWDTPPLNEMECPFYKSNKNYPNDFGTLNNNLCEMPSNMKRIGYRFYSSDLNNLPLCHNCKTDIISGDKGTCCDKQLDKIQYPNLISPDYAFDNDLLLRNKYSDILSK
jgi:hypothetical protein